MPVLAGSVPAAAVCAAYAVLITICFELLLLWNYCSCVTAASVYCLKYMLVPSSYIYVSTKLSGTATEYIQNVTLYLQARPVQVL
jgi:hypothetical protein